jgi:hypothetical protein
MTREFTAGKQATIENFDNSPAWYDAKYGESGWHDADECDDLDTCKLAHRHDTNCKCADCCAQFDDEEL